MTRAAPMNEPQDVLAGRLLCEGRNHDHEWLVCRDSETLAMFLDARGYALVRTPETLDVEPEPDPTTYWTRRRRALTHPEPSPTPPEGLRAVLEAKHERDCSCPFDGTDPDCNLTVSGSWLGSWFAASPAPDPGAAAAREFIESITVFRPVDAELVIATLNELSESPLPGARYAYEVVKHRFAAALAPSAEPPEAS